MLVLVNLLFFQEKHHSNKPMLWCQICLDRRKLVSHVLFLCAFFILQLISRDKTVITYLNEYDLSTYWHRAPSKITKLDFVIKKGSRCSVSTFNFKILFQTALKRNINQVELRKKLNCKIFKYLKSSELSQLTISTLNVSQIHLCKYGLYFMAY